ncbi:hypothetical protein TUM4637_37350 [Shewanella hafniensis]|uniref:hypothetical protein n=1 Tax=Shewanella hafniensis TaxID=365590 RepID=UPI001BBC0E30|nr:hypothetical protein [Shewanella hafniensis]MCL1136664.1 hypothetical protein [Shewanella hafniensis]GIU37635.1 hypothetical protein TUM4637_37350 [Shewanella hafniensis]
MKTKVGLLIGTLCLSNFSMANGDPDFISFALKQAHDRSFYGCDAGIKNTFRLASGSDIRVFSDTFKETQNDSLKLTGIYGSKGDTVFLEAEYRVKNKKCYVTESSIITSSKSCTAYASEMKAFNFLAETGDYIVMKNQGGIPMFLKPLDNSCIAIFQTNSVF